MGTNVPHQQAIKKLIIYIALTYISHNTYKKSIHLFEQLIENIETDSTNQ